MRTMTKLLLVGAALGGVALYTTQAKAADDEGEGSGPSEGTPMPTEAFGTVLSAADLASLRAVEDAAQIPDLAAFLAIVGAGESNWKSPNPWTAHNLDPKEVDASSKAVDAGVKRGLPPLKYEAEARKWGSGGAFGLLAPYALWSGRSSDYPLRDRPPDQIFDRSIQLACAADTVARLARQDVVHQWLACRVAWKGLQIVKDDPSLAGKEAQDVLARMHKRVGQQNLDALLPVLSRTINTSAYPGLSATLERLG